MDINTFREKSKVVVTDELIKLVVEGYLDSDMPFYNSKNSLMSCFEKDKNNKGKIDKDADRNFVNEIMLNNLFDKNGGKESYMKKSEEERLSAGREESKKLNEMINKSPITIYSTKGILPKLDSLTLEHEFIINVRPEEFVDVLSTLYRSLRAKELDGLRIVTPATRYVFTGYHAPIKIKCSSKDLASTLELLGEVEDKIKSKTKPVLPIFNATNEWFGYQQYLPSGVSSSSTFCSAIYDAIYQAVNVYIEQDDLYIDENTTMSDYLTNAKNKFVAMREIIKKSLEYNNDLMASIIEVTKNRFFDYNVNMVDCLRLPSVERELDDIYGKITTVEDLFKERQEESINIGTPVKITYPTLEVSEEEQRLNNLLESNNVEEASIVEEVVSTSTPYVLEKSADEQRLDDLLQNALGESDEKQDLLNQVEASEPLVVSENFVPGTNDDPALNSLINNIEKAKETFETLEKDNASTTAVGPKQDFSALAETETKEFVNDAEVLIPDLSDVAYEGDDLNAALRTGGYWEDIVYKRGLAEHFGIKNYEESPEQDKVILDNLRHLERFNRDGSPKVSAQQPQLAIEQASQAQVVENKVSDQSVDTDQSEVKPVVNEKSDIELIAEEYEALKSSIKDPDAVTAAKSQLDAQVPENTDVNIAFNNGPIVETNEIQPADQNQKVEVTNDESYKTIAAQNFGVDDYSKIPGQAQGLIERLNEIKVEKQQTVEASAVEENDLEAALKDVSILDPNVGPAIEQVTPQEENDLEAALKTVSILDPNVGPAIEEQVASQVSAEQAQPAQDSTATNNKEDLNQEEVNSLLGSMGYQDNPPVPDAKVPSNDEIYIPDLSRIPYDGNDLKKALRVGGCFTDEEHLQQLATYFNLGTYEGTREQDATILAKLRGNEVPKVTDKQKFIDLVSAEWLLDLPVKGQNYTVADYFEKYNILDYIKPEQDVIMHNQDAQLSAPKFMSQYFIYYLKNTGADEVQNILNHYIDRVIDPKQKKRGLFSKK